MSNIEREQTELKFQNQLIVQLRLKFHTSETEDVFLSVNNDSQLCSNRRKQTDLFNGAKLSDSEFRRFYKVLEAPNSVYKCANELSQIQTIAMNNGEKQNLIYYL